MCLVARQRSPPQQTRPRPCASTTATLVRSGLLEPAIMWVKGLVPVVLYMWT